MADSSPKGPTIRNADFLRAVEMLDAGDVDGLVGWVAARPSLLTATAEEDGSFAGDYFARPKLLWFVAENPVRNGVLPGNIVAVTEALLALARRNGVEDLVEQASYTLALVASGAVARECGAQAELARLLVSAGADPNAGVLPALAHREREACETLLECGAKCTLSAAAGLGRADEVRRLLDDAGPEELREALAVAAINGEAAAAGLLLALGLDPNFFHPEGLHAHSTPLHQAVLSGSIDTVRVLVRHGADASIRDGIFDSDAQGWAHHAKQRRIAAFLRNPGGGRRA